MTGKCSAITKAGARCTRPALAGGQHCLMHSPNHVEVRREAARRGGLNRATAVRAAKAMPEAMSAADLTAWLSLLFKSMMAGKTEARIGTACAAIARTLLEAQVAASQPDIAELEEQLAVLRAMIERGQGRVA
jgi:hypothetical protein